MLNELRVEEAVQGRTLMDVLDVHWYPEATGGGTRITFGGVDDTSPDVVAARVQAPRSLWDPGYVETSWITQYSTGGNAVALLPRMQQDIDDFKPGTKIAITEYNYGGGAHISGAIAQADVLGVFGEEGVFAGTWWNIDGHDASDAPFVYGAFDMFRNYDGTGGQFGDISVQADSDAIEDASVYASLDSEDPDRMVLIAINRTDQALDAAISVTSDRLFETAEVYQLTSAGATPNRVANVDITLLNAFHYTMPAYSVSTLVLTSSGPLGDFDGDGDTDVADLLAWQRGESPRPNSTADLDLWREGFGTGAALVPGVRNVPEPAPVWLLFLAAMLLSTGRARSAVLRSAMLW